MYDIYIYMYLIIGNKKYCKLPLNSLIDNFENNVRFNLSLPNNNNGTKYDKIILNNHIHNSLEYSLDKSINIYSSIFDIDKSYLNNFYSNYKKYKTIIKQKYQGNTYKKLNDKLKSIGCPHKFIMLPRVGIQEIMDNLDKKPYVIGFSIKSGLSEKHNYINNLKYGDINKTEKERTGHDEESEIKILLWLHNKGYIDATLCMLEDKELPFIKYENIIPSEYIIYLLIKTYGIVILNKYFNNEIIDEMKKEVDNLFNNNKKNIQILDKENCSKDERIFYVEKYSNLIKNKFSNDELFNKVVLKWIEGKKRKIDKKCMINRLIYEDGIKKNSGAGWHRDNHVCQFKAICYLTDVSIKNGNFQFITNSTKDHIGMPKSRGINIEGNSRYKDELIEELLKNNDKCKLYNIIGDKGTVLLVDTTNIHRGNIIKEGERYAITQYYFT